MEFWAGKSKPMGRGRVPTLGTEAENKGMTEGGFAITVPKEKDGVRENKKNNMFFVSLVHVGGNRSAPSRNKTRPLNSWHVRPIRSYCTQTCHFKPTFFSSQAVSHFLFYQRNTVPSNRLIRLLELPYRGIRVWSWQVDTSSNEWAFWMNSMFCRKLLKIFAIHWFDDIKNISNIFVFPIKTIPLHDVSSYMILA